MYNSQSNCEYYGSMIGCRNGTQCRFSHSNPNSVPFCRFPNNCFYGNQCRFRHVEHNQNMTMAVPFIHQNNNHIQSAPQWQQMSLWQHIDTHHLNQQQIPTDRFQLSVNPNSNYRQRKEMIVYGYTRTNSNNAIPNDILLLLCKWYITALFIPIKGDLLIKFLQSRFREEPMEKAYEMKLNNDISLTFQLMHRYANMATFTLSIPESTN